MGKPLNEIAQELLSSNKKVQLIYGFNGVGKTRLSREFKKIVEETPEEKSSTAKALYYNAFTEDLFYWDNSSRYGSPRLMIHPNAFTQWIFEEQGQDSNVIKNFQYYTSDKLYPRFNAQYTHSQYSVENKTLMDTIVPAFSEVRFAYECGNNETPSNIKISKGEESCFVWSVFYALLEQAIEILNINPDSINQERETSQFDDLKYVFIDDPVSSLDDNHLIELAVNLATLIKQSESELKFIITTHNPLFYNVLYNEFRKDKFKKYILKKDESNEFDLVRQKNDSPFSYHLFLIAEIEKAIANGELKKYHFNFLRNVLEKTSIFLGYENWGDILPEDSSGSRDLYATRIVNISSHSKHSAEEISEVSAQEKKMIERLIGKLKANHKFKGAGVVQDEKVD